MMLDGKCPSGPIERQWDRRREELRLVSPANKRKYRVIVVGTGGLSHQLDGERAGFINKDFDLKFMDSLIADPTWATKYSIADLVELTGTQGVELLMWLATRGALSGTVTKVHANYHIPISNTASGLMVLQNAA